MELKELCEKTLEIFDVKTVNELGESLMRACKENDAQKFDAFAELVKDLNTDWLQKIFQYYQADRKEKNAGLHTGFISRFCVQACR